MRDALRAVALLNARRDARPVRRAPAAFALAVSGAVAFTSACAPADPLPRRFHLSARVSELAPAVDEASPPPSAGHFSGVPLGVEVVDLGLIGVLQGRTGEILVETENLGALQVLVFGHPGAAVVLERAIAPDGAAVVDDAAPDGLSAQELAYARGFPGPVFSVNRVLPALQSGAFLLPNTPGVQPLDGEWRLRVGQYAVDLSVRPPARVPLDRPVRVVLVGRGRDTGSGRLRLNVHRAGLSPAVRDDAFLQAAIDVVRTAWRAVALELDEVHLLDVTVPTGVIALAGDACEGGDLDALFADAAESPPAIDVFVVDRLTCVVSGGVDVGASLGGLAGGIPGPAWLKGSGRSGVVVASEPVAGDASALGAVMAHELGHFLGLYHTLEPGGAGIHDEIEDSPAGDDADENLMYHVVRDELRLSEGQGIVLRTSPWVTP